MNLQELLKEKLQKYMSENRKLQNKLQESEQLTSTAGVTSTSIDQSHIGKALEEGPGGRGDFRVHEHEWSFQF